MDIEKIGEMIVDSVIKVHKTLGPGLLESAYQACLARELSLRGLKVACEVALPITYEGEVIQTAYRIDMLVEDSVIIENKTVDEITGLHEAQLLTYLRLSHCYLGYLLNWKTKLMKSGIRRLVNGQKPLNLTS